MPPKICVRRVQAPGHGPSTSRSLGLMHPSTSEWCGPPSGHKPPGLPFTCSHSLLLMAPPCQSSECPLQVTCNLPGGHVQKKRQIPLCSVKYFGVLNSRTENCFLRGEKLLPGLKFAPRQQPRFLRMTGLYHAGSPTLDSKPVLTSAANILKLDSKPFE